MIIARKAGGRWGIRHANKWLKQDFATEEEAEKWGDANVDDQMFDGPNCLAPPLEYEE